MAGLSILAWTISLPLVIIEKCPWKIECFLEDLFLGSQWSIILGYRRLSVKSLIDLDLADTQKEKRQRPGPSSHEDHNFVAPSSSFLTHRSFFPFFVAVSPDLSFLPAATFLFHLDSGCVTVNTQESIRLLVFNLQSHGWESDGRLEERRLIIGNCR